MLDNLPWHALNTEHARFALCNPSARRYPADVAPFGGTLDSSADSLNQLLSLMEPGETVYVMGDAPANVPGLVAGESSLALQMVASDVSEQASPTDASPIRLSNADAGAMTALTAVVYPNYFRVRTCELGTYFGIHVDGELVAMAGERMAVPGCREISGVCTHPAHAGNGYAAQLISCLLVEHARKNLRSFLQVGVTNHRAIKLYTRLGFKVRRDVLFHPLSREKPTPTGE